MRVRVLNVDVEARKLVLSMRQKPRASSSEQGDVTKYADMLAEVRKPRQDKECHITPTVGERLFNVLKAEVQRNTPTPTAAQST